MQVTINTCPFEDMDFLITCIDDAIESFVPEKLSILESISGISDDAKKLIVRFDDISFAELNKSQILTLKRVVCKHCTNVDNC